MKLGLLLDIANLDQIVTDLFLYQVRAACGQRVLGFLELFLCGCVCVLGREQMLQHSNVHSFL